VPVIFVQLYVILKSVRWKSLWYIRAERQKGRS